MQVIIEHFNFILIGCKLFLINLKGKIKDSLDLIKKVSLALDRNNVKKKACETIFI